VVDWPFLCDVFAVLVNAKGLVEEDEVETGV
jgi:hypothetical protein